MVTYAAISCPCALAQSSVKEVGDSAWKVKWSWQCNWELMTHLTIIGKGRIIFPNAGNGPVRDGIFPKHDQLIVDGKRHVVSVVCACVEGRG